MIPTDTARAGTLVTSINPRMVRVRQGQSCGPAYQRECLASWIACGFDVVSLNSPEEADLVKSLDLPVRVETVAYFGPPLIRDLVDAASASGSRLTGIVNSDCSLQLLTGAMARIEEAAKTGIVLVERIENDPLTGNFLSQPLGGFDGFFFTTPPDGVVMDLKRGHPFRIGDVWWDFWFPCVCLANDLEVRQCMLPLLSHLEHERDRSHDVYLRNGELFRRELVRLVGEHPDSRLTHMLQALPTLQTITLKDLAYGIHAKLWQSPGSGPLACAPSHLNELERYVYFLRSHHRWTTQRKPPEKRPFSLIQRLNHWRLDKRRSKKAKRLADRCGG